MKRLNIGIIGVGWPGQMHARALTEGKMATLYACADLDEQRRSAFKQEFKPAKSFGDYAELLNDSAVDAVIICLPNFLHFPASLAALEAGKHVLCEKPPTLNVSEMQTLRAEAKKRGLIYYFSRQYRFTPAMRKARELVDAGRLGKIYHGHTTFIRSRGIPVWIADWFTDKRRSGGGALIDIGVHALDSVWYLMGTPRAVSVSAQVFQNFAHLVKAPVFDVEDSAFAFIRFENGAVVQLEAAWAGNLPDDIPPRQYFDRELINATVFGTKATIRLNPPRLFEDQAGKLVTVPLEVEQSEASGFRLQLQNFVESITGKAKPVNNAEQAVDLMQMLDAIYASSRAGKEISLAAS